MQSEIREVRNKPLRRGFLELDYRSGKYEMKCDIFIHPKTGEPCPSVNSGGFHPLVPGYPIISNSGLIASLETLSLFARHNLNWKIGDNVFSAVDIRLINDQSEEKYREAKDFLMAMDGIIRERFPGYGLVHREGDPEDREVVERETALSAWAREYQDTHPEEFGYANGKSVMDMMRELTSSATHARDFSRE